MGNRRRVGMALWEWGGGYRHVNQDEENRPP